MNTPLDLGDFLISRRSQLKPEDIGMSSGSGRRRVEGLRRQEVATAAGISLDYYTRMEQGRATHVSSEVVESLAETLRLTKDETRHLHLLAGAGARAGRPIGRPRAEAEIASPALEHILDTLTGAPALVMGRGMAVLAWNRPAAALLGDFANIAPAERNLARLTFLDATWRSLYADWQVCARLCATHLRREIDARPEDTGLTALIGELAVKSADFREHWARQPVRGLIPPVVTVQHSIVGRVELAHDTLLVADDSQQAVLVLRPVNGASAEALRLLLDWTTETDVHTETTSDSY